VSGFRAVSSRHAYRGFSSVRIDVLEGPTGTFSREVVEHADAVAIVAIGADGRVAFVRQYRHPLASTILELPAGTLDVAGESPVEAAHRELAEEVGLACEQLLELGSMWNSAGWSDERTVLFLALDLRPAAAPDGFTPEHEEATMSVEWHALTEMADAARAGSIEDAKTVIGLLRAEALLALQTDDVER
jgi:ADP-ribose pyrophosphatase